MRGSIHFGFTMMELLLALTILSVAGMVVVPALSRRSDLASHQLTLQSMSEIRRVILSDYRNDMFETLPYPSDPSRVQHPQLKFLYDNPLAYLSSNASSIEATSLWTHDVATGRGWSGPYIDHGTGVRSRYSVDVSRGFLAAYGATGDPTPVDGWGNPIVLQQPVLNGTAHSSSNTLYARLVSSGPNGLLQTPLNVHEPTVDQIGDDIVVYLRAR